MSLLSHNAALGGISLNCAETRETPVRTSERRSLEFRALRGFSQGTDHRVYSARSVDADFFSETHKHWTGGRIIIPHGQNSLLDTSEAQAGGVSTA